MISLLGVMVLSALFAVVNLSLTTPNIQASSGGALEELGDMLGFDSNNNGDEAPNSDNTGDKQSTLAIPNITQREEPQSSSSSESLVTKEEFAMNAELEEHESDFLADSGYFQMEGFGMNVSPNSEICPNECLFEFEDGQLYPNTITGDYVLEGRLNVGVEQDEGTRSSIYNVRGELDRRETLEQDGQTTDFLGGGLKIGTGNVLMSGDIEYNIANGSIVFDDGDATLILQGEKR